MDSSIVSLALFSQGRSSYKTIHRIVLFTLSADGVPQNAFKPIKEKFGFSEYYGENWDNLWDCMQGCFTKGVILKQIMETLANFRGIC